MDEKDKGETSILLRFCIKYLAAYYINQNCGLFVCFKKASLSFFGKGNELGISYLSFTLCSTILAELAHH